MPLRPRTVACLVAMALLASACRPADAPKEPTDPQEPQVSRAGPAHGGMALAVGRRVQAIARL